MNEFNQEDCDRYYEDRREKEPSELEPYSWEYLEPEEPEDDDEIEEI